MPFRLGSTELSVVLALVVLLFGVGRVSRIGAELGKGIRSFREGLTGVATQIGRQTARHI